MNYAKIEKELEELKKKVNVMSQIHYKQYDKKTEIYSGQNKLVYIPSRTADIFHADDSFVRLVMGPFGSGKSTLCAHEIVRRACAMPFWHNGRRRSRWAIVRNTSGELQSTTLATWLQWFGDLGDIYKRQKPLLTYEHTFRDDKGTVELELIFIALDRPDDVRKIKSLELTGVYLNELSELPSQVLSHFKGRINGRYPSKQFCAEKYWSGIIADTNPPDVDHWIYKQFEELQTPGYRIFHQPPGLILDDDNNWIANKDADNAKNLSDDYYIKLALGQTKEFINVFCLGKYGSVGTGKNVYTEFNSDLHALDDIEAIQGLHIELGWDFGLTPACIVVQLSPKGQLLVLKEYIGDGIGIKSFAENVVIPSLKKDFPYCKLGNYSVGDPAGAARDTINEEMSCIGELNNLGISTTAARTNDLQSRLSSVRYFLNRMTDGKPAFVLSRKHCPVLYRGFTKDYIFKRLAVSGEERYHEKPDKNYASHIHDALQYICLELASDNILVEKNKKEDIDMYNPVMRTF